MEKTFELEEGLLSQLEGLELEINQTIKTEPITPKDCDDEFYIYSITKYVSGYEIYMERTIDNSNLYAGVANNLTFEPPDIYMFKITIKPDQASIVERKTNGAPCFYEPNPNHIIKDAIMYVTQLQDK